MKHDLNHTLNAEAGCLCRMADIHNCVICGKRLRPDRQHMDTCGQACFKKLLAMQRNETR